jgi:Ca-activated chloride channel family protein
MSGTATGFGPISVAGETVNLSMQRLWLTGEVLPVGARVRVQHVFRSAEKKPLEVIYAFPLPRDAALRSFRISGDGFEVHSELKETEAAVKVYEAAMAAGSLAAMTRQYGDGLVNLTVGNIRPEETVTVELEIVAGVEVRDDGFRFRFPFTLAPAYHPRARMAGGEMELPADEFGDVILPPVREDARGLHQVGFDVAVVTQSALEEIASVSHAVRVRRRSDAQCRVALAQESDVPDRDLVLDARYAAVSTQVLAAEGHFAAVVPSSAFGANPRTARRVVILLDRSGSMQGPPLQQAVKSINACLGTLSEQDQFGLIAFDGRVEAFAASKLVHGSREHRGKAREFLKGLDARGGTELAAGFAEAARMLGEGGGDVLILTDGQVAGTEEILARARAAGVRLHCLGIGSASQDRFLALLARNTGGVSRFVTARERVDLCALDLFASIGRPIATGLQVDGDVQPTPPGSVLEGAPVVLFGEGLGPVLLRWDGGELSIPVPARDSGHGDTIRLLQGARLITDWDSRYPAAEAVAPLEKRKQSRVAAELRRLSLEYGLASREVSLVAVSKRAGDKPGELPETRVVPVGMAQDTAFWSCFGAFGGFEQVLCSAPDAAFDELLCSAPDAAFAEAVEPPSRPFFARMRAFLSFEKSPKAPSAVTSAPLVQDRLMELASQMEPDGGMPGGNVEERAGASVAALLAFVSQEDEETKLAFRSHIERLVGFLNQAVLTPEQRNLVDAVVTAVQRGRVLPGDWVQLAEGSGDPWAELRAASERTLGLRQSG